MIRELITVILIALFTFSPAGYVSAASTESFVDDFNDNSVSASWSNWGGITEQNFQFEVANGINDTAYHGMNSASSYDLTGSYVVTEMQDAGNQSLTSWEAYPMQIYAGTNADALVWFITGGQIYARYKVAGASTHLANAAYDSDRHRYFRIRESGGTVYWDWSTNGTSWTNFTSVATPITITGLTIEILAGTWQNEASATLMYADNLNNICTTNCNVAFVRDDSWTAPVNVTSAKVACWGGGGGGGDGTTAGAGGGGGGAFASSTVAITAGTTYNLDIGAAGAGATVAAAQGGFGATSTFATTTVVAAPGWGGFGASSANSNGGLGGATASSTGDVTAAGGKGGGGTNTGDTSGGGGGAAGAHGAGADGTAGNGTVGGAGGQGDNGQGGAGGSGGNVSTPPNAGTRDEDGGGGGGGADDGAFDGPGATGGQYGAGGGGGEDNGGSGKEGRCEIFYNVVAAASTPSNARHHIIFIESD